jgi:hypothetical protein
MMGLPLARLIISIICRGMVLWKLAATPHDFELQFACRTLRLR